MLIKTLGTLMCIGVLAMLAGCSVHRPPGNMQMHETPVVASGHFRVFDANGVPSTVDAIVRAAITADVVFIGEEHDDPVAHYLEAELLKRLYETYGPNDVSDLERRVVLSMEMFERDVQTVMNEYLEDLITERHFLKAARPWPSYRTDYRPLIEFAKAQGDARRRRERARPLCQPCCPLGPIFSRPAVSCVQGLASADPLRRGIAAVS